MADRRIIKRQWRYFTIAAVLAGLVLFSGVNDPSAQTNSADIVRLVALAGNTDDEVERVARLKELRELPGLDGRFRKDLDELVSFAELWINPDKEIRPDPAGRTRAAENGYLCWFFKYRDFDERYVYSQIVEDSPLYPIARLYEARERMWATFQSGNIWNVPELRDGNLSRARECFEIVRAAFPDNRIARMHLGEPIPWAPCPTVPGAPEWAVLQREGLEKLADIVEWWIDNRMLSNGEFGGGWGDDCEMYRWWAPVLFAFHDPKIADAQAAFSRAVLSQPHHRRGYTEIFSDVEHTAEDTGDTITPMMHIDPDNAEWSDRAARIMELMETVWTGRNGRGRLQFKSTYFNVERVSDDPYQACDTPRHLAAMQPSLLYWLRTGDERAGRLFTAWMDCWVDAAAREADGKPAGVIPGAIYWPDGALGRDDAVWWEPKNNPEPALYRWPTAVNWVTDTLLQTWWMTGNDRYLEPIRSMATIRLDFLGKRPAGDGPPGSLPWCAARMGSRLSGTLAKYRFLTGDDEFDDILARDASPYVRFRLNGDTGPLIESLRRNAEAVSRNFEGFTSEVRYTDRVMVWPSRWLVTTGIDRSARSIDSGVLYRMATGDVGDYAFFPMNAVRWLTPPRDIAVFVTESGGKFGARLFHFGTDRRDMAAELYLLPGGTCTMTLKTGDGTVLERRDIVAGGSKTKVAFTLPPRKVCVLEVRPKN